MWPLPMVHWTSLYRSPPLALAPPITPLPPTSDLGLAFRPHPQVVTSGGYHWRPVHTCSFDDYPSPLPGTTSGGCHWSMHGFQAGSMSRLQPSDGSRVSVGAPTRGGGLQPIVWQNLWWKLHVCQRNWTKREGYACIFPLPDPSVQPLRWWTPEARYTLNDKAPQTACTRAFTLGVKAHSHGTIATFNRT